MNRAMRSSTTGGTTVSSTNQHRRTNKSPDACAVLRQRTRCRHDSFGHGRHSMVGAANLRRGCRISGNAPLARSSHRREALTSRLQMNPASLPYSRRHQLVSQPRCTTTACPTGSARPAHAPSNSAASAPFRSSRSPGRTPSPWTWPRWIGEGFAVKSSKTTRVELSPPATDQE